MTKEDTLIQAQAGDEEAIDKIIKQHKNSIYRNGRNFFLKDGDFNDLIQEGYIGLIKAIKNYNEDKDASFSTFANLCIKRQMITAMKKSNTEKYKTLNEAINNEEFSDKKERINYKTAPSLIYCSPEDILLGKELLNLLEKYLDENLSGLEKNVFYHLVKQQTYVEIAEILDQSPKRIDNTIQRIKRKVRDFLETYSA